MSVHKVLLQLANSNLKTLHQRTHAGTRAFDTLATLCAQGPVTRRGAADGGELAPYFAVFDFAARNRFGSWILDYVAEVCGDSRLTSNDALEAQLLDGRFVKTWCHRSLQAMETHLLASLHDQASLEAYSAHDALGEISLAEVVISVLKALGGISGTLQAAEDGQATDMVVAHDSNGVGSVSADLSHAARLRRMQLLVRWFGEHQLARGPPSGPFASLSEWTRRVQLRREGRRALHSAPNTFLDGLLKTLSIPSYPFHDVPKALDSLAKAAKAGAGSSACTGDGLGAWCVAGGGAGGDADAQRWECCLALAVYYLTDLGILHHHAKAGTGLLDSLTATLHIPPAQLATWCAAPLLDDSLVGLSTATAAAAAADSPPVMQATHMLLAHAPAHLHISFLQVLSHLGHGGTALLLHRAREQGECTQQLDVATAWALTELRLRCGLVAEAVATSRQHAAMQPDVLSRRAVLSELLRGVLEWCAERGEPRGQCRAAVMELCCGEEEEDVLVSWLLDCVHQGRPVGHLLPVMLAARGCVPEALAAYQRLAGAARDPTGTANSAAAEALINCAAEALPLPLRNVQLDTAGDGGMVGARGLLAGLSLASDVGVPPMRATVVLGSEGALLPPALASTRVPALPAAWNQQQPSTGGEDMAGGVTAAAAPGGAQQGLTGIPAGGSIAFVSSIPGPSLWPAQGTPLLQAQAGAATAADADAAAANGLFSGAEPVPPPLNWLASTGPRSGLGNGNGSQTPSGPLFALPTMAGAGAGAAGGLGQRAVGEGMGNGADIGLWQPPLAVLSAAADMPFNKRARPNTWAQ